MGLVDKVRKLSGRAKIGLVAGSVFLASYSAFAERHEDESDLHYAVRCEDLNKVRLLIYQDNNINVKDEDGRTPLHYTADLNIPDIAELFINSGANINAKDEFGSTPLHHAARYGHEEIAELLISKSADVNSRDKKGKTPLHFVAVKDNLNIAKLLIDNGADVNAVSTSIISGSGTPLHEATEYNNLNIAKLLIDNGADVNAKAGDYDLRTPLHNAARYGHEEIAELLISKGADVNSRNYDEKTPLHHAARYGRINVAELLISKGANVNAIAPVHPSHPKEFGYTPLHNAAYYGHEEIAELLISKGANVNARTRHGKTPRDLAHQERNIDMIWVIDYAEKYYAEKSDRHYESDFRPDTIEGRKMKAESGGYTIDPWGAGRGPWSTGSYSIEQGSQVERTTSDRRISSTEKTNLEKDITRILNSSIALNEKRKRLEDMATEVGVNVFSEAIKNIPIPDIETGRIVTYDELVRKMVGRYGGSSVRGSDFERDPVRTGVDLLLGKGVERSKVIQDPKTKEWMSIGEAMDKAMEDYKNLIERMSTR